MASEVKWIKFSTDTFNNKKIKQIKKMPDGANLIVIWMQILCLAASVNDHGVIYLTEDVPYTEDMLAIEFDCPVTLVKLALTTFERFHMIDIVDEIIKVSNWDKYQNVDGLEKIREKEKLKKQKQREKKKQLALEEKAHEEENEGDMSPVVPGTVPGTSQRMSLTSSYSNSISNSNSNSSSDSLNTTSNLNPIGNREPISNNTIEPEATIELEGLNVAGRKRLNDLKDSVIPHVEADIVEQHKDVIDYQGIADMFNKTCVSYPKVTKMSNDRKKAIKARLNEYSMADMHDLFVKAERSDFLKGKNDHNWIANFDWLIKSANMAKVLDGNYENRQSKQEGQGSILDKWFNA